LRFREWAQYIGRDGLLIDSQRLRGSFLFSIGPSLWPN
jgi:hypothetical protein